MHAFRARLRLAIVVDIARSYGLQVVCFGDDLLASISVLLGAIDYS